MFDIIFLVSAHFSAGTNGALHPFLGTVSDYRFWDIHTHFFFYLTAF
jgi:hypothetical protein